MNYNIIHYILVKRETISKYITNMSGSNKSYKESEERQGKDLVLRKGHSQ